MDESQKAYGGVMLALSIALLILATILFMRSRGITKENLGAAARESWKRTGGKVIKMGRYRNRV